MHRVSLPPIGTATAWREAARGVLAAGVPPEQILWGDHAAAPDLFGEEAAPASAAESVTPAETTQPAEPAPMTM